MPRIPVSHARPPSTFAQVSKVAGLGTGVLVLCGAVYTASTIGQHNTEQQAAAAQQPLISGADALRPESVSAELADVAQQSAIGTVSPAGVGSSSQQQSTNGDTSQSRSPSTGVPSTSSNEPTQNESSSNASPGSAHGDSSGQTQDPARGESNIDVAKRFYHLVGSNPHAAADMLAPNLSGHDYAELVREWSSLRSINVENLSQGSNNTVMATVRLLQQDGSWLRVSQLLTMDPSAGQSQLISDAQLISAQRG